MAHLLIVEDSLYQRTRTRHILEAAGHQVRQAANGREGLSLVMAAEPDCILLDLIMPEMGGIEVLEALRTRGAQIPVIVVSADIQESTKQHCLELGARMFLNKPPQPDELIAAITTALTSTQATRPQGAPV